MPRIHLRTPRMPRRDPELVWHPAWEGRRKRTSIPPREDFVSPAEFPFYRVLCGVVGDRGVVCPKVNLNDIFYVASPQREPGIPQQDRPQARRFPGLRSDHNEAPARHRT